MSRELFETLFILFFAGVFGLAALIVVTAVIVGPEKRDVENNEWQ